MSDTKELSDMTQINAFFYTVAPNEQVTIVVTPEKVGPHVVAAKAGKVLKNVGGATPTFKFKAANDDRGTHIDIVKLSCNFPGTLDTSARYVVKVSGVGNENFPGPIINKADPIHAPNVNFILTN
jgi:hypothetical protein